ITANSAFSGNWETTAAGGRPYGRRRPLGRRSRHPEQVALALHFVDAGVGVGNGLLAHELPHGHARLPHPAGEIHDELDGFVVVPANNLEAALVALHRQAAAVLTGNRAKAVAVVGLDRQIEP